LKSQLLVLGDKGLSCSELLKLDKTVRLLLVLLTTALLVLLLSLLLLATEVIEASDCTMRLHELLDLLLGYVALKA